MLKSNNNGDATIKCLNLDLFNEGVQRFCATILSKFKHYISVHM